MDGGNVWTPPSSGVTGTTHDFTGLTEGDEKTIMVRAVELGADCAEGLSSLAITCVAKNCPGLTATVTNPHTVTLGNSTTLELISTSGGSGNFSYEWDNGLGDGSSPVVVTPNATTTYTLTVTDLDNPDCPPALASVNLTVVEDPTFNVYFPEAFSPNGDDVNDVFKPVYEGIADYTLSIFNRWGEKVHLSIDPELGWDGSYLETGSMVDPGVFLFVANIEDPNGQVHIFKGTVTITE